MRIIRKDLLTLLLFLIVSRFSYSVDASIFYWLCSGDVGSEVVYCDINSDSTPEELRLVSSYTIPNLTSDWLSYYQCVDVTSSSTFTNNGDSWSISYYDEATGLTLTESVPFVYHRYYLNPEDSDVVEFRYADLSSQSSITVYRCNSVSLHANYDIQVFQYAYFNLTSCFSSDTLSVAGETYTLVEEYTGTATYIVGAICVAPDTLVKYCNDSLQVCYNPDTEEVSRIVYVLTLDSTSGGTYALFCKYEVSADVQQLQTLVESCSNTQDTGDNGDTGTGDTGTGDTIDTSSIVDAIEQNSMYLEDAIYDVRDAVQNVEDSIYDNADYLAFVLDDNFLNLSSQISLSSAHISNQIDSLKNSVDSLHADINNALYVDPAYSDSINSHVNSVLSDGFDTNIDGIPEKSDIAGILYNFLSNSPVAQVFQNARIEVSSTVCSIDVPIQIFSASSVSNLDFCRFQDVLSLLGSFILVFSHLYAFYIVFKKD